MTLLAIILGLLPGFAWLFFYLEEDMHPEPKKLVALTFFVGMVSAFAALILERALNQSVSGSILKLESPLSGYQLIYLVALASIEEIVKFGTAYFSVHKSPDFDEPVDAMIYMVVAALGFATLENIGAISSINYAQGAGILGSALATTSIRFVGATLLHSLTAALLGYYWAIGIRELEVKRYVIKGLVYATGLHAIFNYLIINYGNIIYVVVFLTVIGFFVLNDFERLKRRSI